MDDISEGMEVQGSSLGNHVYVFYPIRGFFIIYTGFRVNSFDDIFNIDIPNEDNGIGISKVAPEVNGSVDPAKATTGRTGRSEVAREPKGDKHPYVKTYLPNSVDLGTIYDIRS